jgi:putative OPT family oligopeptide transporter
LSQPTFEPYVSPESSIKELSLKAVLMGIFFGILFGATTVYLGLKVGLTVGASIPIAVLAISLINRFSHSTILENNIVQTVGSAGEAIAGGVIFTLPALIFLEDGAEYFGYIEITTLAFFGGLIGILFMIPLRKVLIVDEHERLPYPEGTACADVLIAGESEVGLAKKVYAGIGIAFLYKFFMSILGLWKDVPGYVLGKKSVLPMANISCEITPELLGVGYIIGPRIAGILFAGGALSSFVLTPLVYHFGSLVDVPIAPGEIPISEMSVGQIWNGYVRYIGSGAVALGGIFTMLKSVPIIITSVRKTLGRMITHKNVEVNVVKRTDRDIPLSVVIGGAITIAVLLTFIPNLPINFLSAVLIVVAAVFFVTVSSRIVGLIGTSSNPISGMTIATLMGASLLFIWNGWTEPSYQPMVLCIGAIVTIASASAGSISQDLKTGFILGATPSKQQIGMMIGCLTSVSAIGFTVLLLYNTVGIGEITEAHPNPLPAPQATLMATIIKGLLNQDLPWSLVLLGMAIAFVVELCGVNSLGFAVGVYLPVSTTLPIFVGGMVKWVVDHFRKPDKMHSELEPGTLFSSGLIAGGAITGILIAVLMGVQSGEGRSWMSYINTGFAEGASSWISLGAFALLIATLFYNSLRNGVHSK